MPEAKAAFEDAVEAEVVAVHEIAPASAVAEAESQIEAEREADPD